MRWPLAFFSRRVLLNALPVAVLASVLPWSSRDTLELQDVSPGLMQAICAHCAAFSKVRRLAHEMDLVATARPPSTVCLKAFRTAVELERQLWASLISFPTRNEAEHHDKAVYLSGLFGSELEAADDISNRPVSSVRETQRGNNSSRSFTCFPPRIQSFWPFATWRRYKQKLSHVDDQRGGQSIKQIDRWIEFPAFNFADGPAINSRIHGEVLLTDPLCGSNTSKVPRDAATSIHADDATNLRLSNLSDIADIFDYSLLRRKDPSREKYHGGAVPQLENTVRIDDESWG